MNTWQQILEAVARRPRDEQAELLAELLELEQEQQDAEDDIDPPEEPDVD